MATIDRGSIQAWGFLMAVGAKTSGAARARPARKRLILPAEVRVDDLMSAAAGLFIDKGIEATTVNDIVEKAGVGKGTFYHYFAAKEDVILALRERFSRDFTNAVADAITVEDALAPICWPACRLRSSDASSATQKTRITLMACNRRLVT